MGSAHFRSFPRKRESRGPADGLYSLAKSGPPPPRGRAEMRVKIALSEGDTAMLSHFWKLASLCSGLAVAVMTISPASAQSVEQFYRGRTITMLVGTSPGGINDISARLVARHFGRFVPGNPSIVVQNNPGAGGLVTANRH